jgi:hypothetical protein
VVTDYPEENLLTLGGVEKVQGINTLKGNEYTSIFNPNKSQYTSIFEEPIDDLDVIIMIGGVNLNDGES